MKDNYFELNKNTITSGSVAYDLSAFALPATQPRRREEPVQAPKPVRRPRPVEKAKTGIPVFAVIGAIVCVVLAVMVIRTCADLNEINNAIVSQQSELSELQKASGDMAEKYNTTVDLEDVERQATDQMEMVYADSDQMVYLDLSGQDDSQTYHESNTIFARLAVFAKGILN